MVFSVKKFYATILVIDDNEDDQTFIVRAFRKIGVTDPIQVISGGNEAIAYMKGEGKYADRAKFAYPTFIMTDLKMPQGDGFAVLYFLKSNPDWAVIPTVVFSASSDLDDIKKSYLLGASSYHLKPHSPEKLQEQVAVLYAYWVTCEVPVVDSTGKQLPTDSTGKLGERFRKLDDNDLANSKPLDLAAFRRDASGNTPAGKNDSMTGH
jgi:CheY-like chemotaxis protein